MLYFSDATVLTSYITNYLESNINCVGKEEIVQSVAKLAAERFANSDKTESEVKRGVMFIIHDLRVGVDGLSGKPLPNLGNIELDYKVWHQITKVVEQALIESTE